MKKNIGGFGEVYVAEDRTEQNKKYAIKIPKREYTTYRDLYVQLMIVPELSRANPFIATTYPPVLGKIKRKTQKGGEERYLIQSRMDLYDESLDDYISKNYPRQKPEDESYFQNIAEMLIKVTLGVQFLHTLNYIHRDIKPENILRSNSQNDWVICDLGMLAQNNPIKSVIFNTQGTEFVPYFVFTLLLLFFLLYFPHLNSYLHPIYIDLFPLLYPFLSFYLTLSFFSYSFLPQRISSAGNDE